MEEKSDTPRMGVLVPSAELKRLQRERDEALAEVERLRPLTICGCGDHFAVNFEGTCPNCKWEEKRP